MVFATVSAVRPRTCSGVVHAGLYTGRAVGDGCPGRAGACVETSVKHPGASPGHQGNPRAEQDWRLIHGVVRSRNVNRSSILAGDLAPLDGCERAIGL